MNWVTWLMDGGKWTYFLGTPVIVMLLSALLVHRLALRRERQTASRKAALEFRAAFLSALKRLYPLPANWPANIDAYLQGIFPALQTAVAQFRPYIPSEKRQAAFDRAWSNYRSATGRECDIQCYHHYMDFRDLDEPGPPPNAKNTFRRNVDELLAFADEVEMHLAKPGFMRRITTLQRHIVRHCGVKSPRSPE